MCGLRGDTYGGNALSAFERERQILNDVWMDAFGDWTSAP